MPRVWDTIELLRRLKKKKLISHYEYCGNKKWMVDMTELSIYLSIYIYLIIKMIQDVYYTQIYI